MAPASHLSLVLLASTTQVTTFVAHAQQTATVVHLTLAHALNVYRRSPIIQPRTLVLVLLSSIKLLLQLQTLVRTVQPIVLHVRILQDFVHNARLHSQRTLRQLDNALATQLPKPS